MRKKIKFWVLLLLPALLCANPKGGKVIKGDATIHSTGSLVEVHAGEKAVVHWDEFSILSGETTRFIQPSKDSAILNRVAKKTSYIHGLLEANGRVYLLNPSGMVVGKEGVIQAHTFIATTLDLDNDSFSRNQDLLFRGRSESTIVNLGKIEALGGDVFLFARAVLNEGAIHASEGIAGLASGEEIFLKPSGQQRLFITTKKGKKRGGTVSNKGLIASTQAELALDGNVYRLAMNENGIIEAGGVKEENGRIYLVGQQETYLHEKTDDLSSEKIKIVQMRKSAFHSSSEEINSSDPLKVTFSPSSSYIRAISEMFQDLKTYDEFLFNYKYFLFGYDKECYHQHLYPKGILSSFDLYDREMVEILRNKYRNYHLKYVDSF